MKAEEKWVDKSKSDILFKKIQTKVDKPSCLSDFILILIGKVFKSSTSENKDWKLFDQIVFQK